MNVTTRKEADQMHFAATGEKYLSEIERAEIANQHIGSGEWTPIRGVVNFGTLNGVKYTTWRVWID
jgi:hypothetical protein